MFREPGKERELDGAAHYYEQQSPGLGERSLDEVASSTLEAA